MTWLNPLALFGLLAVAAPVLVHLFGRRVARRQRFPSLRLLRMAAPSASTTNRPSDVLLLIVRSLTVAIAALALAQPLWSTGPPTAGSMVTRAIIVDTSASMRRPSDTGADAREQARTIGAALLDSARDGLLIETTRPGANITAAASWLARQPGMRELVVVSDFQRNAVNDGDLAHVPPAVGVRPVRVELARGTAVDTSLDGIRIRLTDEETEAGWERAPVDTGRFPLTVLHAAEDEPILRTAIEVVRRIAPPVPSQRSIAVVLPGYGSGPQMPAEAGPLTEEWQGDLVLALGAHPLVRDLEATGVPSACGARRAAPVPNARGQTVAEVAAGAAPYDVLVFSCIQPRSAGTTALLAAVASSSAPRHAWGELESAVVPDETLRRWTRQPTEPGPVGGDRTSPHGRWVWLVVLLLLGLEQWLRRQGRRRETTVAPPRRANAA
ncbi:MAG TPA: BatA domain-containing protein [Gemmatimonadaceae bacterium]